MKNILEVVFVAALPPCLGAFLPSQDRKGPSSRCVSIIIPGNPAATSTTRSTAAANGIAETSTAHDLFAHHRHHNTHIECSYDEAP